MDDTTRKARPEEKDASQASIDAGIVQASFERLYESCDEKLVLFETRDGHLVAVDSSRLV